MKDREIELAGQLDWYALWVPPQKEFVGQAVLKRYGLTTFVPVRREWRRRHRFTREKRLTDYPIAPRYVFAGFPPSAVLWFDLFRLPVIHAVVALEGAPMRIPSSEMAALMRRLGNGLVAPMTHRYMPTHREFQAGDVAEIVEGPFTGHQVPIREIRGNMAIALIELFGGEREIPLPLSALQAA